MSGAAYSIAESVEDQTIRHGAGRIGQEADASAAVGQIPELAGRIFSRNKLEAACVEDRVGVGRRAEDLRVAGRVVDHVLRLHAVRRLGDAVPECVVVIGFCQGAGDTVGSGSGHAVPAVVRITRDQYTALVLRNQVAGVGVGVGYVAGLCHLVQIVVGVGCDHAIDGFGCAVGVRIVGIGDRTA